MRCSVHMAGDESGRIHTHQVVTPPGHALLFEHEEQCMLFQPVCCATLEFAGSSCDTHKCLCASHLTLSKTWNHKPFLGWSVVQLGVPGCGPSAWAVGGTHAHHLHSRQPRRASMFCFGVAACGGADVCKAGCRRHGGGWGHVSGVMVSSWEAESCPRAVWL